MMAELLLEFSPSGYLTDTQPVPLYVDTRCIYNRREGQLHDVNAPLFYTTPFASPQLALIELDDEQWRKFHRRPVKNYAKRIAIVGHQLSLLDLGISALILWALKAV
jgi:hypothetical protein